MAAFASVAGIAAIALAGDDEGRREDQAEQEKLTTAIEAATGSTADHTGRGRRRDRGRAGPRVHRQPDARGADVARHRDRRRHLARPRSSATAQDVARFAGVDLATAADAVAKAQAGQDGALTKMLPGLEKGATATDTLANAQALAAGQADAYSKTTEAGFAKTSDAMGELGETVGAALLPALDAILPAILPMIKSLGTLVSAILPLLIPLITLLGKALGVVANVLVLVVECARSARLVATERDQVGRRPPREDRAAARPRESGRRDRRRDQRLAAGPTINATATSSGGGSSAAVVINVTSTGDSLATERAIDERAPANTMRLNAGPRPAGRPR